MNRTHRLAALAAALTIPTGIAVGSVAFAQSSSHVATVAAASAQQAESDAETNDGPDRDNIQEGPGNSDKAGAPEKADAPETGDKPDAPAAR